MKTMQNTGEARATGESPFYFLLFYYDYSIMIDETTDVGIIKEMVLYAYILFLEHLLLQ